MQTTILHIDFNSYFASVEQQKNPFLRGKPVGVIKAEGRTVIIAASYEAKRRGVKTGTSVSEVKQLCPEILLVPADFDSYDYITHKFYEICNRYSDLVELFSLDEVFLDVSRTALLFGDAGKIAFLLKKDIREELGEWLPVSIGIAKNKLLAKLASDLEKPNGLVEITGENLDDCLGRAEFEQICGIGRRLEQRLRDMGITQLLQIRSVPERLLAAGFGPYWSKQLRNMSWGEDSSPIVPSYELPLPKTVSRTHTLFKDVFETVKILAVIRNLVEEAAEKLRLAKMSGRQFGLMVRSGENSEVRFITRKYFSNDSLNIFQELKRLFLSLKWRGGVRFLGVWIGLLAEENSLSQSLLPEVNRRIAVLSVQDKINLRFGHYTLFPASLLQASIIHPEVNGYLGDERIKQRINEISAIF
ncbi:DNA polymerase IV [Candidatus Collierbacteria bacterium]|nr:DNA polymerase IV [Candidatus Collierbacteria bacterium]